MPVLTPIPDDKQERRGWQLSINGKPKKNVSQFELTNDRFGTVYYGLTPAGYDGWCFGEKGGGGSVIVPYVLIDGSLYIGLVQQDRYTQGGKVWNVPRGFLDPGETHFEAAEREAGEEFRFNVKERFALLDGEPQNPNSAFFLTRNEGEGVRFYRLQIKENEVEEDPDQAFAYRLKKNVLKPASKSGELIFSCKFVPYEEALALSDMFTAAGVGRLLPVILRRLVL